MFLVCLRDPRENGRFSRRSKICEKRAMGIRAEEARAPTCSRSWGKPIAKEEGGEGSSEDEEEEEEEAVEGA